MQKLLDEEARKKEEKEMDEVATKNEWVERRGAAGFYTDSMEAVYPSLICIDDRANVCSDNGLDSLCQSQLNRGREQSNCIWLIELYCLIYIVHNRILSSTRRHSHKGWHKAKMK